MTYFINIVEKGVESIFREKTNDKKFLKSDGTIFRSNNLIPRKVRALFKAKSRASKAMKTVTSVKKCLALRKRICDYDNQLRLSYEDRKRLKEEKIFEKSKENKNVLYKYIKKCQKSNSKIGPFIDNGSIMEGESCDILQSQYTSVFSNPLIDKQVTNPHEFFIKIVTTVKKKLFTFALKTIHMIIPQLWTLDMLLSTNKL